MSNLNIVNKYNYNNAYQYLNSINVFNSLNTEMIYNVNDILHKFKFNQHLNDICDYPKFFDAIKH